MDHGIVGGIINNLPIEKMVAAPLVAAINAQKEMSKMLAQYINEVGLDSSGNVRMVTFKYTDREVDSANQTKDVERAIQAPFIAMTGVPNFAMEEVRIDFELNVATAEESKSALDASGSLSGKVGWGPFSASFSASISHKSEQTRKTDTRAKYSFNVLAKKQDTPEPLMRIIDYITESATKPVEKPVNKENLMDEGKAA